MNSKDSDKWTISVCGLNCAKCDIYAAAHGNEKTRDEIVAWFKQERNQTLSPDDVGVTGVEDPLTFTGVPTARCCCVPSRRVSGTALNA